MKRNTKETLYNKSKEELTLDEKIYINKVLNLKSSNRRMFGFGALITTLATMLIGGWPMFIIRTDIMAIFFTAIFGSVTLISGISATISSINENYKGLYISKKEYRQLVKSGRLKQLEEMINDIKAEALINLEGQKEALYQLESDNITINQQIQNKKQETRTIIQRMIEEKQITNKQAEEFLLELNIKQLDEQTEETEDNIIGV